MDDELIYLSNNSSLNDFFENTGASLLSYNGSFVDRLGFPAAIFNGAMRKGSTSQQKEDKQEGVLLTSRFIHITRLPAQEIQDLGDRTFDYGALHHFTSLH